MKILQNGVLHFVPEIALESYRNYLDEKPTFPKEAWHLKG